MSEQIWEFFPPVCAPVAHSVTGKSRLNAPEHNVLIRITMLWHCGEAATNRGRALWRRVPARALFGLLLLPAGAWPQTTFSDIVRPSGPAGGGVHVYSASAYSAYLSSPIQSLFNVPGAGLGNDVCFGASVSMGWTRLRPTSSVSVTYLPSFYRLAHNSRWRGVDQSLALTLMRHAGRKWAVQFGANLSTFDSITILFSPAVLGRLIDVPARFDEFAGMVYSGQYNDRQIAAILTGTPVDASPAQTLLFGDRLLGATVAASLSYSRSQRLTFRAALVGTRSQSLPGVTDGNVEPMPHLIARSTSAGANLGVEYSLSRMTKIGADLSSTRIDSPYLHAFITSGSGSVVRMIGRRWFVRASAGVAKMSPTGGALNSHTRPQYTTSGAVGLNAQTHTLAATYSRTVSDPYGLGSDLMNGGSLAWKWHPLGRRWGFFASGSYERMTRAENWRLDSWRYNAGIVRALTMHTGMTIDYARMSYRGVLQASRDWSAHAVRASFFWNGTTENRMRR